MKGKAERGAAIVMAMLVVAATTVLVSGAFWRQSVVARQAENELSYAQAKWLIRGAVDWAGVILREDGRTTAVDHLGEPWTVPLAETQLNKDDGHDPVFISGQISDEQGKFNLRNLAGPEGVSRREVAALQRLLALVGASEGLAGPIAQRVLAASPGPGEKKQTAIGISSVDDLLSVADVSPAVVERLRPFVTVLPEATAVNANTAPAVVLAARFEKLALADALRLIASRDRTYFKDRSDVLNRINQLGLQANDQEIAVASRFFLVDGTVTYRRARLHAQALLKREAKRIEPVWLREAS
jgi:general secretion pathway protein K